MECSKHAPTGTSAPQAPRVDSGDLGQQERCEGVSGEAKSRALSSSDSNVI